MKAATLMALVTAFTLATAQAEEATTATKTMPAKSMPMQDMAGCKDKQSPQQMEKMGESMQNCKEMMSPEHMEMMHQHMQDMHSTAAQGMQGKDDMKPDGSAKDVQPAADHAAHHPQTPAKK